MTLPIVRFVRRGVDDRPALSGPEDLVWGADVWIRQTYECLHARGALVQLAGRPRPERINVLHADDFLRLAPGPDCFTVVVRPDRPPVLGADHRIVQSPAAVRGPRDHFVPHWPQPGLRPRDPARGDRPRRVAYFGRRDWLAPEFRSGEFRRALADLGLELVLREREWWNYEDVDVVLAVRRCHPVLLARKPAVKLTNAWAAGCPALLGREPAYRALRCSGLDYEEVETPEDAVAALRRLVHEPERFRGMVENGRVRAPAHGAEAVARRWLEVLDGPVRADFQRWRRAPAPRRAARRLRGAVLARARHAAWDIFDLRVGTLSPREVRRRSPSRTARAAASILLSLGGEGRR